MGVNACAGPFPSAHGLPAHLAGWWSVPAYGWVAHCGRVACWDLISEVTMAPSCCQEGLRIFPEPRPAPAYRCHLYLHLSLPRHGSGPRCLRNLKPWMSSNVSLEGDIPRVWASGSVVNLLVGTCLGGSLGNQPQVWLRDGKRGQGNRECLGVLHWKALENLAMPWQEPAGTPGCSGAQYHGKKQELVRKASITLKRNNPYGPTEHGQLPGRRHGAGTATWYLM